MSGQIYFTSDTHAYHKNICFGSTTWDLTDKTGMTCRDFKNEVEMTEHIIEQINKTVGQDDILYHLGDWSFGGKDKIALFRNRLVCKNIHLCYGNHDEHIRKNMNIPFRGEIGNEYFTPQSLFSSVQDVKLVSTANHQFFLSHYGHRVWLGSNAGYIHLYGHSHTSLPPYGKSMDVGMDNAKLILGEYRPFHINEILNIMKDRAIEFPDKHTSKSNVR